MVKISDIEGLIAEYGGEATLNSILNAVKNHECAVCNGVGFYMTAVNTYPANLPDSLFVERWESVKVPCKSCNGLGYKL